MSEEKWVKKYVVRDEREWAAIMVDSGGMLAITSAYGNWAYHWFAFGKDFQKFLSSIEPDYLVGKLTMRQKEHYDSDETIKTIKEAILRLRRQGYLDAEKARAEWDLVGMHSLYTTEDFGEWLRDSTLDDAYEYYRSTPDPQCIAFARRLWPVFIEELGKDPPQPLAAA